MPRPKRWADLIPGLAVLAFVTAAVGAVLIFAEVGGVRGRKSRIYAAIPSARGVIAGTEVWLAGRPIGTVADVVFRPPSLDTASRVLLVLDVLDRDRHAIRKDADVRIAAGGSVVGVPVVAIGLGTPTGATVAPGDTLRSRGATYVQRARADLAAVGAQVPAILANLRLLGAQLGSARGTLGALGATTTSAAASVEATTGTALRLADRTLHGPGTTGLALRGGLAARAQGVMASVDSVRALLASSRTSLGRFRRDSTLLASVTELRSDVDALVVRATSPEGTTGRAAHDRAIRDELARTRLELDALITDVKRHPLRYLSF